MCTLGCEYGWLFATGDESKRLFDELEETCDNAVALNCSQVMCAPGQNVGPMKDAIENLKRGAESVGEHGLTLAIEFNSQHDVINCIARAARNARRRGPEERRHAARRLSLERSGAGGRGFEGVAPVGDGRVPVQRRAAARRFRPA